MDFWSCFGEKKPKLICFSLGKQSQKPRSTSSKMDLDFWDCLGRDKTCITGTGKAELTCLYTIYIISS